MYTKPKIEVIKIENEGVMALSGGSGDIPGPDIQGSPAGSQKQNSDTMQEVENLINDLFTY